MMEEEKKKPSLISKINQYNIINGFTEEKNILTSIYMREYPIQSESNPSKISVIWS